MIRLVGRVEMEGDDSDHPSWLVIEGDEKHGFLVRAFRDLGELQVFDDWVRSLDDAYEYGEAYGIAKSGWRPRTEALPGPLPFPDVEGWVPDNSGYM